MKTLLFSLFFLLQLNLIYSQAPTIAWQNTIGGSLNDDLQTIYPTLDGGYIAVGTSDSPASGDKSLSSDEDDIWVVKMDALGEIEWEKTITAEDDDKGIVVIQNPDGSYIIGATSESDISGDKTEDSQGNDDFWVLKLNAVGNILWQNTIGGVDDDVLTALIRTSDGGYLVGGYSQSPISGDKTENNVGGVGTSAYDYWIIKLTSTGSISWQNTIGSSSSDYLKTIQECESGGFILGGYSSGIVSGDKTEASVGLTDYWVIKINNTGSILWQNSVGGAGYDYLSSIYETSDNGFIVGGYSESAISGEKTEKYIGPEPKHDYWILKLDATGALVWQNTIGGNSNDYLTDIKELPDHTFIVAGFSYSPVSGDKIMPTYGGLGKSDLWILKLTNSGEIFWQAKYGGNADDNSTKILLTEDDSYVIGSKSMSNISGDKTEDNVGGGTIYYDYWMIKTMPDDCVPSTYYFDADADGFGGVDSIFIGCTLPVKFQINNDDCDDTKNYCYPGAFEIIDGIDNNCDAVIDEGTGPAITWQNTIGGDTVESLLTMCLTDDGGSLLIGSSYSGISGDKTAGVYGDRQIWLVKLNSSGDILWQQSWSASSLAIYSVIQTADGGYFLGGGKSMDYWGLDSGYWIAKLNNIGEIQWSRTINGDDPEVIQSVNQTSDGGYILAGISWSDVSGDKTTPQWGDGDFWIIKIDAYGNIEWEKDYGAGAYDRPTSITQTSDGGYIFCGESAYSFTEMGDKDEPSKGSYDIWVLKLDNLGEIEWQNLIGGTNWEVPKKIIELEDNCFIVAAESNTYLSGDKTIASYGGYDYWILKLDATGEIIWQKQYGGALEEYIENMERTSDGGFFLTGQSGSSISGNKAETCIGEKDAWVIKIDSIGTIEWQNTIGGSGYEFVTSGLQTDDSGYLLGMSSQSDISGDKNENVIGPYGAFDYWVVKLGGLPCSPTLEICNGIDDDCDGAADEGFPTVHSFYDEDGDGFGNEIFDFVSCVIPAGYVLDSTDCNDLNAAINAAEIEICNSLDDNCNGLIDDDINVTISLSADGPLTFCKDETVTLNAVFSGETVQWLKNGTAIPGATSPSYTAFAKGTYKCKTYNDCDSSVSAGLYVNVLKGPPASITAAGPTTFCDGGSVILSANTGIAISYQWFKDAVLIPGATSINYTATSAGTYKCKVTKAFTGCSKNSNAIIVSVPCRTGEEFSNIHIFPNPANNFITIQDNAIGEKSIKISNALGETLIEQHANEQTTLIDISFLPAGLYYVSVESNNIITVEKIIKI